MRHENLACDSLLPPLPFPVPRFPFQLFIQKRGTGNQKSKTCALQKARCLRNKTTNTLPADQG
jgi:hypothetical protein